MNIVVDQLTSKPNTQAMLTTFLTDMKQFFKKSPNLSEDKTYARILKMAETIQKYLPHYYSISNIALKLVGYLKSKVDDKFENQKEDNKKQEDSGQKKQEQKKQSNIKDEDIELLQNLHTRLSRQNDAAKSASISLGREVNQEFMKKLVLDSIDDLKDQFADYEEELVGILKNVLERDSNVLVMESYLTNKSILTKVSANKGINFFYVTKSTADPKKNELSLTQVASRMRKFDRIIISAESILKNGAVISEPGSLMVALAAKKYNVPILAVGRGFCLTEKVMIDQYSLLAENPMKYFKKSESSVLKAHIAKKFDLIESKFIDQIVSELGSASPSNIELQFSSYYDYC